MSVRLLSAVFIFLTACSRPPVISSPVSLQCPVDPPPECEDLMAADRLETLLYGRRVCKILLESWRDAWYQCGTSPLDARESP